MKNEEVENMGTKTVEVREAQHKKFLLVLPLLVIPFITLGFKLMGGGTGIAVEEMKDPIGLNAEIPGAKLDEKMLDKLAFYNQAERDSLKRLQLARQDPYYVYRVDEPEEDESNGVGLMTDNRLAYGGSFMAADRNERLVYDKLQQLNAVLESANGDEERTYPQQAASDKESSNVREDIDRLERMMLMMQQGSGEDPEMQQINSVLENILDLQHPERVQDRIRRISDEQRDQVFGVTAYEQEIPVTLLEQSREREYSGHSHPGRDQMSNGFYGLDDYPLTGQDQNVIEAVVHEAQTIISGTTVKLRLLQDLYLNGKLIPRDQFVYGIASLRGERLEINIQSIRHAHLLFPVQLSVYDLDGIAGIHIPGAISRDVAKQSGDQALQGVSLGMYNPSIGAQAASAGIELGRNLLSRKIKLVKVEVKAGYKVLLKDNKRRES